jgi:hypothetical protein
MNKIIGLFSLAILISCSSEETKTTDNTEVKIDKTKTENSIQNIETLFDKDQFDDPKKAELLQELKICSDKNTGPEDYLHPSCTPRFFNLFPFAENVSIENAFILQVKSKVNGFPLRRLLIFVREKGQLVKINGFVANLIGRKKSKSKHDDLLLRFNNKDQGQDIFFNCLFKWNGTTYKYHSVEAIEGVNWGGPVKAELKDSISIEVEKDILANKMIF